MRAEERGPLRKWADRLGVSVRTIDGHLYRIFGKLGIDDRD